MEIDAIEKKLTSGAELKIWLAAFPDGHALFKAVSKTLEGTDIGELTVQQLSMRLLSSEILEAAIWKCMGKATYKGQRITKETFEPLEARSDFMEVMEEVMAYNLVPFSKNVASLSKVITQRDIPLLKPDTAKQTS